MQIDPVPLSPHGPLPKIPPEIVSKRRSLQIVYQQRTDEVANVTILYNGSKRDQFYAYRMNPEDTSTVYSPLHPQIVIIGKRASGSEEPGSEEYGIQERTVPVTVHPRETPKFIRYEEYKLDQPLTPPKKKRKKRRLKSSHCVVA